MSRSATRYLADFDSATGMLRATARFLHGKDFPTVGLSPAPVLQPFAAAVNILPDRARELVYSLGGAKEAIPARDLGRIRAEELARWMAGQYPRRTYPAIMIGSSNGAAVHLCAALGIPWLPQTFLVPVRRTGIAPDDMKADMEWGRKNAGPLLERNPELQLHHMHDPNQDHLMIRFMTYFRLKRRRLGTTFERFITESLEPGGTIFVLECEQHWPSTRVGDRHFFQAGAVGGLEPEEYLHGSPRVADFLARYGFDRRAWDPPEPDAERPEAEWGFEPALREDIERLARQKGYRVRRIVFPEPDALSPLVADLHRRWYRERGMPADRLLVESFILLEPWWALRTGSVPFWTKFAVESSAEALERYLDAAGPFDEIGAMLFSHGTESAGLAPLERWKTLLDRACTRGRFVGVEEEKFPKDFAAFGRYHTAVQTFPARWAIPGPLLIEQLDAFLDEAADRYRVRWIEPG